MPDRQSFSGTHFFLFLLTASILLTSCSPNLVNFKPDRTITDAFESYEVIQGYNYYYLGPEAEPEAILGIHDNYRLTSELWKKVELTRKQLKGWMERIDNRYRAPRDIYWGCAIVDKQGKQLGIWYANQPWTTVIVGPDQTIQVYPPNEIKRELFRP